MILGTFNQSTVVLDFQGNILEFRNRPPDIPDKLIGKSFKQLIHSDQHSEIDKIIKQIHDTKMIVRSDLVLKHKPGQKIHLIFALIHDQLMVVFEDNKQNLYENLFREILLINNEQLNTIRELQKELSTQTNPPQNNGNNIYDKLISTNNELSNLQRQLAKKNIELEEALKKVKLLSGLIPICANCKKIRNDDGYYEQIEKYITDHSNAQFSHGICPDCMVKLYPEFTKKKQG